MVYEAVLDGRRVAAKKPVLSTSDDLDKFHRELQLLRSISASFIAFYLFIFKELILRWENSDGLD